MQGSNKLLMVIGLILLVAVLIGVTVIEPLTRAWQWLQPLVPMIVITGFFVFLVAAVLFLYGLIGSMRK